MNRIEYELSVQPYTLIRRALPENGAATKIGNVTFWIDQTGPWQGELSYDIPATQWDKKAMTADLTPIAMQLLPLGGGK